MKNLLRIVAGSLFLTVLVLLGVADAVLMEQGAMVAPEAPPPAAIAVTKRTGPDVPAVLQQLGIEGKLQHESTLLEQVTAATVPIEYRTLIKSDRIGQIAWIDGSTAKSSFTDLKQKLGRSFSPKLQDLVDETTQNEGEPVVNRLSFIDPAISEERFIFLRVRERLYEIHVAKGQEELLAPLLKLLTAR